MRAGEQPAKYGRGRLAIAVAGLAILMPALDSTAVTVALPSIERDLGVPLSVLQWVLTAYLIAAAACVIPLGRLADRIGHRRCFLGSLVVFGLASAACGLASEAVSLVAARFVQGVGAGGILALSFVLVRRTTARERFGRANAVLGVLSAVGVALGPLLGGFLSETLDWRWIFLVNVPLTVIAVGIGRAGLPAWPGQPALRVRPAIAIVFAAAAGTILLGLIEADRWTSATTIIVVTGGLGVSAAAIAWDTRNERSLFDPTLFRRGTFSAATIAAIASYGTLFGLLFVLSISFQSLDGDSPLLAGLKLLPYSLAFMLVAPQAGRHVDQMGPGVPMIVGLLVVGLASGALVAAAGLPDLLALGVVTLYGIGQASVMSGITPAALHGVPDAATGAATAITVTARYLGAALGVALSGAIYQAIERNRSDELADAAAGHFLPAERAEVQELLIHAPRAQGHLDRLSVHDAREVLFVAKQVFAAGVDAVMGVIALAALAAALAVAVLVRR